jgi:acyl-coenzyme A thioesterase PaaI-like protein
MLHVVEDHLSREEIEKIAGPSKELAASVRALVEAVVLSEVDADELADVRRAVDDLTTRLRVRQLPGTFGTRFGNDGALRNWGNAATGLRNAVAPPLEVTHQEGGLVVGLATLGAAYEGPATFAHGGVGALLLDQVMGEAAHAAGRPGMTARLTLNYRAPTRLGPVRAEAEALPAEPGAEHKTHVVGRLYSLSGGEETLSIEADGIFILPRAVRERIEREGL